MEFRTVVKVEKGGFEIQPFEKILFVGSCFADSIGKRFAEEKFRATVNPLGVMYNPASIKMCIDRIDDVPTVAFLTLGTNHIYRLKETGEIVDNCRKQPQNLFDEEKMTVEECADVLEATVEELRRRNKDVRVVVTVSPIRYAKYGYHESQLSKSILLLAVDMLIRRHHDYCEYFPAYEIVNDELRDYRFYAEDMLHPSVQAVEYIWQVLSESYFSTEAKLFIEEWRPVKEALGHKPFHPDSEDYKKFMSKTMLKVSQLSEKYPNFAF
jgi:hypothetical protein